jgi:hypothetical protein
LGNELDDGFYETALNAQNCCPVVELRQYTLKPGQRDVLIELFEREFIETQEATGMIVIGQFRDLNNADRFVWLRGFSDMATRAQALEEFYGGPVWKAHRDAANATMIDSDNVLLLRPARSNSGFSLANIQSTLLQNVVSEGAADFIASLVLQEPAVRQHTDRWQYGCANEAELAARLLREADLKITSRGCSTTRRIRAGRRTWGTGSAIVSARRTTIGRTTSERPSAPCWV